MKESFSENKDSVTVSYHEINAMVRLGQRLELEAYFRRFEKDLIALAERDLKMAQSRFISLITILVNSVLEIGAAQDTERRIAEAAELALHAKDADALLQIVREFLQKTTECASPQKNRYSEEIIEKAKQIILDNFHMPITDEWVAQQVHLSRSHFRYLFKVVTGMPFMRFVTEVRLNQARKYLETTSLSVKEICARIGYTDTSGFSRAYKTYHGVPPVIHRKASV
ncbi:MAG TPA: AraC family transcriptional regulator [Fimbriimonadales bacterium]|nr:AraC family transcriptional regulator [Fimbriimonadales bacterium]